MPEAEHAAVHRDLERAKAETAQIARRCEDGEGQARRHLDGCDRARTGAEARVKLLEAQLLSVKQQRGELAGDLRVLEEHVRKMQAERQKAVERRRRRLTISERFAALAESAPELAGLSGAVIDGRLTLVLPGHPSSAALDRIAEVLRALPEDRWQVIAAEPARATAAAAAAELTDELAKRGVPPERLEATALILPKGTPGARALRRIPDLSATPGFEPLTPRGQAEAPPAPPQAPPPAPPPSEEHE